MHMEDQVRTIENREELFREKAGKYAVCHSNECPLREHCLHSFLKDYVPEEYPVVTCINLRNPKMQKTDCPSYMSSEPVRMPLGLKAMYYDMPKHLEQSIKNHLINLFNRKRYYQFHSGYQPVPPAEEQVIRRVLVEFGWTQEPAFDGYVEEYLW